jgi:hypothetical protein
MRRLAPRLDLDLFLVLTTTISPIDCSARRSFRLCGVPRIRLFPSFGAVEETFDVA